MKTIYKLGLILAAGFITVNAMAQREDSTLTRQVMLERDYNPTLDEATKITTDPNIFTPKVQSAGSVKFLDQAPQVSIGGTKLGSVASGDIKTKVPFSQQRFYLNFGAGSHGMLEGALGVRAVDAKNDKLDIFATHSSMNGNVKNLYSEYLYKDTKAKIADTKANIKYQHNFEPSIFTLGASYQNMGYNYYGSPLTPKAIFDELIPETVGNTINWDGYDTKQKVNILSFNAGLKSSDSNEGLLKYEANLGYTNFNTKYDEKGPRGGIITADMDFYTQLGSGNIGVEGSILNQSFSGKEEYEAEKDDFHALTSVRLSPYYKIEGLTWDLTIGANFSGALDASNKFILSPNLKTQIHISDVNTLYASVTGGINNNTFLDILQENRYVTTASRVAYSRTPFDFQVGFKSGVVPNLEFEIFGGYKQVKDDHLYIAGSELWHYASITAFKNVSNPVYSKVSTGHVGGQVKTKLIPMTTLTAKAIAYFYNVKDVDKAWGRPTFTTEITADIKPIDKLTLSLSYLLMTGRKGFSHSITVAKPEAELTPIEMRESISEINMKAISEFNIRAEYEIVKQFSVFARVNNLLDQKYDYQLGYTAAGLNVLGGISLKF